MSDLTTLLERVQKATGPDRELDLAIGHLWEAPPFSLSIEQQRGGKPPVYPFTASLDAALALVNETLPGWTRAVDATVPDLGIDVDLFSPEPGPWPPVKGTHELETHATLIAILRALIAQSKEQAHGS